MCRLRNIAMRDYQESVTTGQTERSTDRQTPNKVIPMCRYALQATQKAAYQESVTTGQTHRQTPDKVIPVCGYASQAIQKAACHIAKCNYLNIDVQL